MEHGHRISDATDQFSVQEVLDMLAVAAAERQSTPSLAPVGYDVESEGDASDFDLLTDLAARRRRLSRYVVGAVGVACVILAASYFKRSAGDNASTSLGASASHPVAIPPTPVVTPALRHVRTLSAFSRQTEGTEEAGTIRFTTKPGWAWLDGQQLSATSAIVPCGTHQVQIGGEEQHDVVVPCGGEVVVTR